MRYINLLIIFFTLAIHCSCQLNSKNENQSKITAAVDSINAIHNIDRKQRSEERKIEVENKQQVVSKAQELVNKINNELKVFGKWGENSKVNVTGCYLCYDPNTFNVFAIDKDVAAKLDKNNNRVYIKFSDIYLMKFKRDIFHNPTPTQKRYFRFYFWVRSNRSGQTYSPVINPDVNYIEFHFSVGAGGVSSLELYKDLVTLINMVSPILYYDNSHVIKGDFARPLKENDETDKRFNYDF